MDCQVAQNRTAKSYGQVAKFDSKDPSRMIIDEVSTEQTTENAQNPNSGSNSGVRVAVKIKVVNGGQGLGLWRGDPEINSGARAGRPVGTSPVERASGRRA